MPTDHIILNVKDQNGNEVCYRIKTSTKLKKLMNAYCDQQSVDFNSINFLFHGRRLRDEQTPIDLEMEDGDEIDAMPHLVGRSNLMVNAYSDQVSVDSNSVDFLSDACRFRAEQTPDDLEMEDGDEIDSMLYLGEHINLKVKNLNGNEVFFRIRRSTRLKKLMNAYCDQESVDFNSIKFLFHGSRLRAEQTPDDLEMEDGDEIDVMLQLDEHVNLKVKNQDGNEVIFRIKRTTRLKKLMHAYCDRQLVAFDSILFLLDGCRLQAEQTPDDLEMVDGDEIDAILQQDEHINLKVKDQDGNVVNFRIRRSTHLKKLINAYCDRQSVDFDSIVFLFDGCHLRAEQTPDDLEMEDGDEINAILQLDEHINLKVKDQDGNEVIFRIKRSTHLEKLMNAYCDRQSVDYDSIVFLLNGCRLRAEQTPDDLEMEDGDEIDAMHKLDEHINLKVKNQDGNEVIFRIKRITRLKKLMNAYCERQSVNFDSILFLFDGCRLRAEQTPNDLEMEDGDEIDAVLQLDEHINLRVKDLDGNVIIFRIKRGTRLKKLMNSYCDRHSVDLDSIIFVFDGCHLRADQTPDDLGMEDGDEIDAMLHLDEHINLKVKDQDGREDCFWYKSLN